MKKYKCEICNKEHAVYYSSDSPLPDLLTNITENGQDERMEKLAESAFIVDNEKLIIKGNLQIETDFSDILIEHYVWVEIPIEEFEKKYEQLTLGNQIVLKGILLSDLPFFEQSSNLKTNLILDKSNIMGQLKIESESQIKTDQQSPINRNRFIQMMQRINHPELWKEKVIFDKPFKERLFEKLSQANSEYKSKGRNFVIDISNQRENLIQLVSSEILTIPASTGIGLYLCNDATNLNYNEVKVRMLDLCENNSIQKLMWDDIETYQKNYQIDEDQIYIDLEMIITRVFEENMEKLELDIFEP